MSANLTKEQVDDIVLEALQIAREAQMKYFDEVLEGTDQFLCGFAWTRIAVKGSTKLGKMLKEYGFETPYRSTGMEYFMPGRIGVQNVDCNKKGAEAFAKHLKEKLGVDCYADSRLD